MQGSKHKDLSLVRGWLVLSPGLRPAPSHQVVNELMRSLLSKYFARIGAILFSYLSRSLTARAAH